MKPLGMLKLGPLMIHVNLREPKDYLPGRIERSDGVRLGSRCRKGELWVEFLARPAVTGPWYRVRNLTESMKGEFPFVTLRNSFRYHVVAVLPAAEVINAAADLLIGRFGDMPLIVPLSWLADVAVRWDAALSGYEGPVP